MAAPRIAYYGYWIGSQLKLMCSTFAVRVPFALSVLSRTAAKALKVVRPMNDASIEYLLRRNILERAARRDLSDFMARFPLISQSKDAAA